MDWRAEWRVCARLVTSPGIGRFVLAGVRAPTGEQPGCIVSSNSGARSATSGAPRTGARCGTRSAAATIVSCDPKQGDKKGPTVARHGRPAAVGGDVFRSISTPPAAPNPARGVTRIFTLSDAAREPGPGYPEEL